MKTKLTANLEEDQVALIKENFVQALPLRKRLIEILDRDIESLHASMRDESLFKVPSWPYIQADRVAQVKALKRLISLLEG